MHGASGGQSAMSRANDTNNTIIGESTNHFCTNFIIRQENSYKLNTKVGKKTIKINSKVPSIELLQVLGTTNNKKNAIGKHLT